MHSRKSRSGSLIRCQLTCCPSLRMYECWTHKRFAISSTQNAPTYWIHWPEVDNEMPGYAPVSLLRHRPARPETARRRAGPAAAAPAFLSHLSGSLSYIRPWSGRTSTRRFLATVVFSILWFAPSIARSCAYLDFLEIKVSTYLPSFNVAFYFRLAKEITCQKGQQSYGNVYIHCIYLHTQSTASPGYLL